MTLMLIYINSQIKNNFFRWYL